MLKSLRIRIINKVPSRHFRLLGETQKGTKENVLRDKDLNIDVDKSVDVNELFKAVKNINMLTCLETHFEHKRTYNDTNVINLNIRLSRYKYKRGRLGFPKSIYFMKSLQ